MPAAVTTPKGPVRLILFDIDGTLLECGGQTKGLLAAALLEVFGTTGDLNGYNMSGRTDPQIVLDLMTAAGISRPTVEAGLPRMRDLYLPRLEARLDRARMRLLPGVESILERLAPHPSSDLALLTGNWEAGARTKLSRFDLNRFFPFGAFGSDAIHRSDLPPIALARAERHLGRTIPPHEALIVGDSIHDISCARDNGLQVLAVATGHTPAPDLAAAGADWVVPDLLATADLLR